MKLFKSAHMTRRIVAYMHLHDEEVMVLFKPVIDGVDDDALAGAVGAGELSEEAAIEADVAAGVVSAFVLTVSVGVAGIKLDKVN